MIKDENTRIAITLSPVSLSRLDAYVRKLSEEFGHEFTYSRAIMFLLANSPEVSNETKEKR